jgi:hypothetical protein
MLYHFESPLSTSELTRVLDDLSAGCDPDFDLVYDELEREFAERRLHLSSIA